MKKLEVNTIKMFLREPVIEFNRPDGGRSIKTISLLDDEEKDLTKDVVITRLLPKLYSSIDKVVRKSKKEESFADKLNKVISQREYMSSKQIAAKAGMTVRYLDMLKSGERDNPTLKTIKKLAEVLECDIVELV